MIAFLGMGLLGSNFVRAMLKRGDDVHVWNRTPAKAKELEQYGAHSFASADEAVRGADFIHLTLKDDASVDKVLEDAAPGFAQGATIIDHTTTSKEGAITRTKYWKEKGFVYQHAPVFMGPANALDGTGHMLISGDQNVVAKLTPHLSPMTGDLVNFGEETGKAAAMKLIGNSFLVCITASIRETLLLAKALNVDAADVAGLFNSWNLGAQIPARLKRIMKADYKSTSWGLAMARKDTGLFLDALEKKHLHPAMLPTIATLMDGLIKEGHGDEDWVVITKDAI
jgi:3-hydroxyisobutyrate dehydrogenase